MDITQSILDDHPEQRRLFAMLEQIDRPTPRRWRSSGRGSATLLDPHAEAEEAIFYPALLELGTAAPSTTEDEEEPRRHHDHNEIRDAMAEVEGDRPAPTAGTRRWRGRTWSTATTWRRRSARA